MQIRLLDPAHKRSTQPYFQPNIYTLNFTREQIEISKLLEALNQLPHDAILEVNTKRLSGVDFKVKNLNGEKVSLKTQLGRLGISSDQAIERLLRLADFIRSDVQLEPGVQIYRRLKPEELPLVSVITATLRSDYFDKTAQSVLDQTYPNLEWIITDEGIDGHTQKIEEIAKGVQEQSPFPVFYFRNDNPLGPINLQTGLNYARGVYVKWLDDDDLMNPGCVEFLVRVMEAFPEVALATTARDPIGPDGQVITDLANLYKPILPQNFLARGSDILRACLTGAIPIKGTFNPLGEPSCTLVRRSQIPDSPFQLSVDNGKGLLFDFVLYLRILQNSLIFYGSEKLVKYRRHQANTDKISTLLPNLAPAWFLMSLHAKENGLFERDKEAQMALEHGLTRLEEFIKDYGSRMPKEDLDQLVKWLRSWRDEYGRQESLEPTPLNSAIGFFL